DQEIFRKCWGQGAEPGGVSAGKRMLLFDLLRIRFPLFSRGFNQCPPLDRLRESAANVAHKIVDVGHDFCENIIAPPQGLEEINYLIGGFTFANLLPEFKN